MHIYFDNASNAFVSWVMEEMFEVQKNIIGNPSSIHYHGKKCKGASIEKQEKVIAEYIHASVGEVYFTSGATESIIGYWGLLSVV